MATIVEPGINHCDLTARHSATGNRVLRATLTPAKEHPSEKPERERKEGGKEKQRERVENSWSASTKRMRTGHKALERAGGVDTVAFSGHFHSLHTVTLLSCLSQQNKQSRDEEPGRNNRKCLSCSVLTPAIISYILISAD